MQYERTRIHINVKKCGEIDCVIVRSVRIECDEGHIAYRLKDSYNNKVSNTHTE